MSASNSTTKFCKKCQAETERNARGECKPCARARCAAWYESNADKHNSNVAAWREANQEKVKADCALWREANSERKKATDNAWNKANKKRRKATSAAWREANLERAKAIGVAWTKANPDASRIRGQNRRARKQAAGGKLSQGLAAKLFKLQKGKCPCCKQPLGDDYHLDHKMPLALGGTNTDDNMQLLRAKCNLQKNALHPVDFMQSRGLLL